MFASIEIVLENIQSIMFRIVVIKHCLTRLDTFKTLMSRRNTFSEPVNQKNASTESPTFTNERFTPDETTL